MLWLVESCALHRSSNYIPHGRPKWQVRTKETATPVVAQWQSQSAESRDAAQSTLDAAWLLALRGATLRSDIVRATIASGRWALRSIHRSMHPSWDRPQAPTAASWRERPRQEPQLRAARQDQLHG